MSEYVVALDCDGPLADFDLEFLRIFEEKTGHKAGVEDLTEWNIGDAPFFAPVAEEAGWDPQELLSSIWNEIASEGGNKQFAPTLGAIDAVRTLRSFATVEVLTKPLKSSKTWMRDRVEWLEAHFGFDHDDVHFSARKHRFVADVFLDDSIANVVGWACANPAAIGAVWLTPRNSKALWEKRSQLPRNVISVDSWEQFVGVVRNDYDQCRRF